MSLPPEQGCVAAATWPQGREQPGPSAGANSSERGEPDSLLQQLDLGLGGNSVPLPGKVPIPARAVLVRGSSSVACPRAASPTAPPGWALTLGWASISSLLLGSFLPAPTCCLPASFSRPRELNLTPAYFSGFFQSGGVDAMGAWGCVCAALIQKACFLLTPWDCRLVRTLYNLKILECKEGLWLLK